MSFNSSGPTVFALMVRRTSDSNRAPTAHIPANCIHRHWRSAECLVIAPAPGRPRPCGSAELPPGPTPKNAEAFRQCLCVYVGVENLFAMASTCSFSCARLISPSIKLGRSGRKPRRRARPDAGLPRRERSFRPLVSIRRKR